LHCAAEPQSFWLNARWGHTKRVDGVSPRASIVLDVGVGLLFAEGVKALVIADAEKGAFGMCQHVYDLWARRGADDFLGPHRGMRGAIINREGGRDDGQSLAPVVQNFSTGVCAGGEPGLDRGQPNPSASEVMGRMEVETVLVGHQSIGVLPGCAKASDMGIFLELRCSTSFAAK
jgi:hypothetical protein